MSVSTPVFALEPPSASQFHVPLAAALSVSRDGGDSSLLAPLSQRIRSISASDVGHPKPMQALSPVQGSRERSTSALALIIPDFMPSPRSLTPVDGLEEAQLALLEGDGLPSPRTPRLELSRSNSTSTLYVKTSLQHPDRVGT
jgi:hypothetical protein